MKFRSRRPARRRAVMVCAAGVGAGAAPDADGPPRADADCAAAARGGGAAVLAGRRSRGRRRRRRTAPRRGGGGPRPRRGACARPRWRRRSSSSRLRASAASRSRRLGGLALGAAAGLVGLRRRVLLLATAGLGAARWRGRRAPRRTACRSTTPRPGAPRGRCASARAAARARSPARSACADDAEPALAGPGRGRLGAAWRTRACVSRGAAGRDEDGASPSRPRPASSGHGRSSGARCPARRAASATASSGDYVQRLVARVLRIAHSARILRVSIVP